MRSSLVIAAHNEGDSLWKTVQSCVETSAGLDYEIVVADDASWDGCVDEACKRFPQLRVVRHEVRSDWLQPVDGERLGPSPTKDLAARHACGDVLVFLDGHTKPEPGAIRQLVESVELHRGGAVVTPAITGLDVARWKPVSQQVGHGYFLELERFDCGWVPLGDLKQTSHRGRTFYESPAAIGCAFAVHRELYDDLRGFDPHMRSWGVEDLDFSLKCWLLGHPILHDPQAVVAHRFRRGFDNFDVPIQDLITNQLRMAYKNFTPGVWREWTDRCRRRHPGRLPEHPEGLWTCAWQQFEQRRASAEQERAYLMFRRVRDEFWYAERFNLLWPRLQAERFAPSPREFEALAVAASASPSPAPKPLCSGVNLIKNPSCEEAGEPPPHWSEKSGDWKRQPGGVNDFPIAHDGNYLFWAGNSASGELSQDVSVAGEADQIDAGRVEFSFSAWLNSFIGQSDTSQVKVEYLGAAGNVLETYDTGEHHHTSWTEYTDVRLAPSGTRTIRIRLFAVRPGVGPSNDGYFDDLSLRARCGICSGLNLIRNPGCELPGEPPPYWSQQSGAWKRQEGGVGTPPFPAAHGGKYIFWAGNSAAGELRQDIDVSEKATEIDNGTVRFRFSGWLNTFAGDDTSRVKVEYRKADDTVLATYDTVEQKVTVWTNFNDPRIAPSGTRKIRVTLLAVRNMGTANDGYFDDLSLVAECNVCGATVRFLDNNNNEISPESKALGVSNYVTTNDLPASSGFNDKPSDPENKEVFRLEVEDAQVAGGSVNVTLNVQSQPSTITYTLDQKSGNKFRGKFLRLVTDSTDDGIQGTQTVLCKLGDTVTLTYARAGSTCTDVRTIGVGRPMGENDNGTDQLKHDIRELKVNVVVFSKPGTTTLDGAINATTTSLKVDSVANMQSAGKLKIENEVIEYSSINTTTKVITATKADGSSGRHAESTMAAPHADNTNVLYSTTAPSLTRAQVNADLDTVDERFAQATIRLKRPLPIDMGGTGDPGKPLPGAMLDGFTRSAPPKTLATLTDDEKAVVAFKDTDSDSIDAFYVERIFTTSVPPAEIRGHAFRKGSNNTGDTKYENFVIVSSLRGPFTLGHEVMHILLDSSHRTGGNPDPTTALFYSPTSATNSVGGTKRIGPYPNDGPGDNDTFSIRAKAENLP